MDCIISHESESETLAIKILFLSNTLRHHLRGGDDIDFLL